MFSDQLPDPKPTPRTLAPGTTRGGDGKAVQRNGYLRFVVTIIGCRVHSCTDGCESATDLSLA